MTNVLNGLFRGRGLLTALTLLLLQASLSQVSAQALDSLAGKTIILNITSGTHPFAASGRTAISFSDSDNSYRSYGLTPSVTDSAGTFTYTKPSNTNGTLVLNDSLGLETANLVFRSASNGVYTATLDGETGRQNGTFLVYSGPAPGALANRVYEGLTTAGTSPFAASGRFRIFFHNDGSYIIKTVTGVQTSSGAFLADPLNSSSFEFTITNSSFGDALGFWAFSNATAGVFLWDKGAPYQFGQIHEVLPPVIAKSPSNTSIVLGKAATLAVKATGDGPFGYQWFFNSNPIPGATNALLKFAAINGTNAGSYYVTVSNDGGTTTSTSFVLNVIFPPSIVSSPQGQTNPAGSTILLSVVASGTDPLRYQWQFNGVNLPGKTNASLTIANAKLSNSGLYRAIVKNAAGTKASATAKVVILTPIKITSFPRSYLANTNAKVLLSVTATGSAPLRYQWILNGTNIAGATTPQYIVKGVNATNTGTYTVLITNAVSATNASAVLFVKDSRFDPNNDGQTDLLIRSNDGKLMAWFLSGTTFLKSVTLNRGKPIDLALAVAGQSDFNKDGTKDLLLQNTNSGALSIWFMNGTNFIGTNDLASGVVTPEWKVVSVNDFDGNGSGDLLAQNKTNGLTAVWLMDGTNFINSSPVILLSFNDRYLIYTSVGAENWSAIGTGNFHGSVLTPLPDILTQQKDGYTAAWFMEHTNFPAITLDTNFTVLILNEGLQLNETNFTSVDLPTGTLVSPSQFSFAVFNAVLEQGKPPVAISPGPTWKLCAVFDFNFDGTEELLFQNPEGRLLIWYSNSVVVLAQGPLARQPVSRAFRVGGPK